MIVTEPARGEMTHLNVVVPCYNEEAVLPQTATVLCELLDRLVGEGLISSGSGIYFIDDGSRDSTWATIVGLAHARSDRVHGIKLSRNCGHQNALLAGLLNVGGDAIISIDADLQDDIAAIPEMVRQFQAGCEIVYGIREERNNDTRFKRDTARLYYWLLAALGVEVVKQHADFRLLGRRALQALSRYDEVNVFLRAMVPLLGFQTGRVAYARASRMAGESKYPFIKMIAFAWDGITSFSLTPLRLITIVGITMSIPSFLLGIWALCAALFTNAAVPGWASTIVPIALVGGLQLFSLGVLGEYVGKVYKEVKRRPKFEIEELH
jgi:glycosyltransferase involved in cell wall biosynthesis